MWKRHGLVRMLPFALLACAVLTAVPGAQQAPAGAFDLALRAFDAFYQAAAREHGVAGSGLVFVVGDRVVDHQVHGSANLEKNVAVDRNTIFHWASITKTFTGIAIMQLRDRGRLSLDDPIINYVPELRHVHNPFGANEAITIRHLLSHSAGFRDPTWPWGGNKPWHPHEPTEWSQLVAMMPYTEVLFRPGSRYSYSNPGIIFLGRVIEHLTGDPYEAYIDKNIFRPLDMRQSYFDRTPYHLLPQRAQSYQREKSGTFTAARFDADTGITVSNGGLNAPLTDMAKYLKFLVGGPSDPATKSVYEGVLKRSSLEEMWVPRLPVEAVAGDQGGGRDSVGMCFFIEDAFAQRFVGHSGHQNDFVSHLYIHPASRSGYIVAYNSSGVPTADGTATDTLDRKIREHLFEKVFSLLPKAGSRPAPDL